MPENADLVNVVVPVSATGAPPCPVAEGVATAAGEPAPAGGKRRRTVPLPTALLGLKTIAEAARELGLPFRWLRRELLEGRLPSLAVGPRLLVNVDALRGTMERRAKERTFRGEYPRH
jgi:hypothetical protein